MCRPALQIKNGILRKVFQIYKECQMIYGANGEIFKN